MDSWDCIRSLSFLLQKLNWGDITYNNSCPCNVEYLNWFKRELNEPQGIGVNISNDNLHCVELTAHLEQFPSL